MTEIVCGKRSRKGDEPSTQQSPFFEVTVHLEAGRKFVEVHINPTLDNVLQLLC